MTEINNKLSMADVVKKVIQENERPKKVFLSLDGGGIRGLMSIKILEEIEKQLGEPIADTCEIIGGTSAGGIISMGKLKEIKTKDLYEIYKSIGKEIFKTNFSNITESRSLANTDKVIKELNTIFGDSKMSEFANNRKGFLITCLSSSIIPVNFQPLILSNYDNEYREFMEPKKIMDMKVVDAVRSTFAIPLLFNVPKQNGKFFLDGGFLNNNPIDILYKEVISLHGGEDFKDYVFISIGTGKKSQSLREELATKLVTNLDKFYTFTGVSLQSPLYQVIRFLGYSGEETHKKFKNDHLNINYFRFDTPIDRIISVNEADDNTIEYMESATNDYLSSSKFKETIDSLKLLLKKN